MSLLMYKIEKRGVAVMTDTLLTVGREPARWATKAVILPHADLVIAATGAADPFYWWTATVNSVVYRDIEDLDQQAPTILRGLWTRFGEVHERLGDQTATIYHFGRRASDGQYTGIAYRSTNDFAAERLGQGQVYVKPQQINATLNSDGKAGWVALAKETRIEQDNKPDGLFIGGDLQQIQMRPDSITVKRVYRWPDFDEHWAQMEQRSTGS